MTGPRLITAPFPLVASLPIGACANASEFVMVNAVARTIVLSFMVRFPLLREIERRWATLVANNDLAALNNGLPIPAKAALFENRSGLIQSRRAGVAGAD